MNLCCGRRTKHKKTSKKQEAGRELNSNVGVLNHSPPPPPPSPPPPPPSPENSNADQLHDEVKLSSRCSKDFPYSQPVSSHLFSEKKSFVSSDGCTLSTFKMQNSNYKLACNSSPDYDNTENILNVQWPQTEDTFQSIQKTGLEKSDSIQNATSSLQSKTDVQVMLQQTPGHVEKALSKADEDLDLVIAMMNDMASSIDRPSVSSSSRAFLDVGKCRNTSNETSDTSLSTCSTSDEQRISGCLSLTNGSSVPVQTQPSASSASEENDKEKGREQALKQLYSVPSPSENSADVFPCSPVLTSAENSKACKTQQTKIPLPAESCHLNSIGSAGWKEENDFKINVAGALSEINDTDSNILKNKNTSDNCSRTLSSCKGEESSVFSSVNTDEKIVGIAKVTAQNEGYDTQPGQNVNANSSSDYSAVLANSFSEKTIKMKTIGLNIDFGDCVTAIDTREKEGSTSSSVDLLLKTPNDSQIGAAGQFKTHRLAVLQATSKLLDFVGEIWRKQENLQSKFPRINLLCLHLKNNLQELENFGLSLVSNVSEKGRKLFEKKLFSQTRLLQNIRNGINRYLESLEQEMLNEQKGSEDFLDGDNLKTKVGNIILLTRVIPGLVRAFGSFLDEMSKFLTKISPEEPMTPSEKRTDDEREFQPMCPSPYQSDEFDNKRQKDYIRPSENPPALPLKLRHSEKMQQEKKININANLNSPETTADIRNNTADSTAGIKELINQNIPVRDELYKHEPSMHEMSDKCSPSFLPTKTDCQPGSRSDAPFPGEVKHDHNTQSPVVLRRKNKTPSEQTSSKSPQHYYQSTENRFSASELVTPDIRASGISMTVQIKLEELQQEARGQNVQLHTDSDCDFMDYDLPAGIMEENLRDLCESDCKLLLFYSDEMFSHWKVLDNAASTFFHCMENSKHPKVFIMYSKFVIVAGHKMAYIGEVLARNLTDNEAKNWLLDYSNNLCDRLKHAVRTTKDAALSFPAVMPLQLMVDAIKDVTDSGYELRELLFRLAYLGKAEQPLTW